MRCLGVQLDSKWLFHEHISKKCTTVKKLTFSLSRYCSQTWGLSSSIIRRLWVSCFEPIITYCSSIWYSSTEKQWCFKQLESVQRLVAIKIIKSFRTVSYEASVTLANIRPIRYSVEKSTICYVMKKQKYFHSNFLTSTAVKNTLARYNIQMIQLDYKTKSKRNEYLRFPIKVIIQDKNEAVVHGKSEINDCIVIFTDGSRSDNGVGCASVFYYNDQIFNVIKCKLDDSNSIFQAEVFAVYLSLLYIYLSNTISKSVIIMSDSVSMLHSLHNTQRRTKLIDHLLCIYDKLIEMNYNIEFHWSPGHSDIPGNELADKYAKISVTSNIHKNYLPPPLSMIKQKLILSQKLLWENHWNFSDKGRITKLFCRNIQNIPNDVTSCHEITQIITGHCRLNFYLQSIGVADSSICRCGDDIENIPHFIYYCTRYTEERSDLIEVCNKMKVKWPPRPNIIVENKTLLKHFIIFLKKTGRLA